MFQNGIIKRPHYLKIIGICGLFIIIDEDTSDGVFVYIFIVSVYIFAYFYGKNSDKILITI